MFRYLTILAVVLVSFEVSAQEMKAADRIAGQMGQMLIRLEQQADIIKDLQAQLQAKEKELEALKHEEKSKQ